MSVEEDIELRDLIVQKTLIPNGCLAKIRAQLRASIFLALSEDEELQKKEPLQNHKVRSQLQTAEGKIMFCLVREFLEFCDLHFTITVYEPESYLGSAYCYDGRCKIIEELGIPQAEENFDGPLLLQLIKLLQQNAATSDSKFEKTTENESYVTTSKKTSEQSILEEQNNKSYSTISEDLTGANNSEKSFSKSTNDFPKCVTEIKTTPKENKLNVTFNVTSPTLKSIGNDEQKKCNTKGSIGNELKSVQKTSNLETILSSRSLESVSNEQILEKDDTYEGTSSITEDSVSKESEKASSCQRSSGSHDCETTRPSQEQSLLENEVSPPVMKDGKLSKFDPPLEKLKLPSQKNEKIKAKNSLSSLVDLPPLQLNKSRGNDTMLLPSLYKKEKSNMKDLDKLLDLDFDSLDNYEEDFMSGTEIDVALNNTDFLSSDTSKINILDLPAADNLDNSKLNGQKEKCLNNTHKKIFSTTNGIASLGKEVLDRKGTIKGNISKDINDAVASDDFDVNSNVEDILHSNSSN